MNTTNETAENPNGWATRFLLRVKDEPSQYLCPMTHTELASVKAQADRAAAMEKALKMVLSRWSFDANQQPTHTWHDMADCAAVIDAALSQTGGQK